MRCAGHDLPPMYPFVYRVARRLALPAFAPSVGGHINRKALLDVGDGGSMNAGIDLRAVATSVETEVVHAGGPMTAEQEQGVVAQINQGIEAPNPFGSQTKLGSNGAIVSGELGSRDTAS
jgi:hypothetical protein